MCRIYNQYWSAEEDQHTDGLLLYLRDLRAGVLAAAHRGVCCGLHRETGLIAARANSSTCLVNLAGTVLLAHDTQMFIIGYHTNETYHRTEAVFWVGQK